jgi:hypothetical protein
MRLKDVRPTIAAWGGHADHADTHRLKEAVIGSAVFTRRG